MRHPLATRYARRGMVATIDHLATGAGLDVLGDGGSAVDAAIAANAVLAVTAPHMCGIGGDLWALVHHQSGPPACLNASGRAGSGADPDALREVGHETVPFSGDLAAVTVPGCVDGWAALHERFGRLDLARLLAPAVEAAAGGFPATPMLASMLPLLDGVDGAGDLAGRGRVAPGTLLRRPELAATLQAVAGSGRSAFYQGAFGEGLVELGAGQFTGDDLTRVHADWVDPISADVWGHRVWTTPPNSQGYVTLLAAMIAEMVDLPVQDRGGVWPHLVIEAVRAAGHDRIDLLHEHTDVGPLLHPSDVTSRAHGISPDTRWDLPYPPAAGDTTYLCVVDQDRMGVSLIQSNAFGFGAHLAVPGTGVLLHNRGIGFNLVAGHPAELGPGRRPPHTLAPALVTDPDGSLRAVLGTMGGDSQPQIVVQLLARLLTMGAGPAAAVAAPRVLLGVEDSLGFELWRAADQVVVCEPGAPELWRSGLEQRGHRVSDRGVTSFGHAHCITVDGEVLAGAADPRAGAGSAAGI